MASERVERDELFTKPMKREDLLKRLYALLDKSYSEEKRRKETNRA